MSESKDNAIWQESILNARQTMQQTQCWSDKQQMGRRWAVGCVALEITQRCNLDCTLCYLSDLSEATKDIPIEEIFRRIDSIYQQYGPNTDIQITGGDPTLRKKDELISIVKRIHTKKMRSTLMTNGIKASRSLLQELAEAGLDDVAFHVDTTQNIKNHDSEVSLNIIRKKYLDRIEGLGLSVMFNITVHKDNFHELSEIVRFCVENSKSIRTISFQLHADTGRGIEKNRSSLITQENVWQIIEESSGCLINNNAIHTGHRDCNRYGLCLVVNNRVYDLLQDSPFIEKIQVATSHITADRKNKANTLLQLAHWQLTHLQYLPSFLFWILKILNRIKFDLIKARGKVTTLSFFIHNFMHACNLDNERIDSCVFKTATSDGFVSMCKHNANRDDYILKTIQVRKDENVIHWHPLKGKQSKSSRETESADLANIPLKKLKGKAKQNRLLEINS